MISSVELLLVPAALLCMIVAEIPPVTQLRQVLAERWSVQPERVHIEADTVQLLALASAGGELRVGGTLADGRVLVGGADQRHLWVRAGLRVHVPVAARDLPRGSTIDTSAVRLEQRVAWGGADPFYALPYGWVTARALRAGDALVAPAITVPVAVRAGDDVRAFWTRGTVRLEIDARAAGTGAVGDTVAVRTAAGRRLRAVIRAPREVILVGSGGTS